MVPFLMVLGRIHSDSTVLVLLSNMVLECKLYKYSAMRSHCKLKH